MLADFDLPTNTIRDVDDVRKDFAAKPFVFVATVDESCMAV